MIQHFIKTVIIFLFLTLFQLTVIPLISIYNVVPDLLLILVVIYSLKYGQLKGTVFGFLVGLFFDLFSGGLLGSAMFSKTLAGFVAGYFHKEEFEEIFSNLILFISILFISALIDSLFYAILGSAEVELNFILLIFTNGVFPAVYTALFGLAYSLFVRKK
ncbi:MAG: rod shape-determining protein MreD [Bacteroidota bacterium]